MAGEFVPPSTRPGEDGWEEYVDAEPLTPEQAVGCAPGTATPEGALLHFYASRMRGDDRWEEVMIPERGRRLERKLKELATWRFLEVKLVARTVPPDMPDWVRIKLAFRIEVRPGKVDSGEDDAGVQQVDGAWRVGRIPT